MPIIRDIISPTQPQKGMCVVRMSAVNFFQDHFELFCWIGVAEAARLQKVTFINNKSFSLLLLLPQVSRAAGVSSPLQSTTAPCCWRLTVSGSTLGPGGLYSLSMPLTSQPALLPLWVLFISVLQHVVCLSCHIFNSAMASFALHDAGTFLRQQYFILRQEYLFPCHPLCVCVCVVTITHGYATGGSFCINLHINERKTCIFSL